MPHISRMEAASRRASAPRYQTRRSARPSSREELKERGAGRPAPDGVASLYREAFERYGVHALWSRTPSAEPTIAQLSSLLKTCGAKAMSPREGSRHESKMPAVFGSEA